MQASESRPQAQGTITGAGIVVESDSDSTGYPVSVLYDCDVNGVRYTGKRIHFSRRF
jgi:hypothetical protein